MPFNSQYYYSNCNLSYDSPEFSDITATGDHYNVVWGQEGHYNGVSSPASGVTSILSTPSIYNSFNSQKRISYIGLSEFDMGSNCDTAGAKLELPDFGEECSGLASKFGSDLHESNNNNWESMQSKALITKEPTTKIGRCSVEERKEKILKYLKKKKQRNFNKTIKYACRKTLADKRVRVRGRFARNNNDISSHELNNYDNNNTVDTPKEGDVIFPNHDLKIKDDDDDDDYEDWHTAIIADLMTDIYH